MKSGTCPKCKKRNVSKCRSEEERLSLSEDAFLESYPSVKIEEGRDVSLPTPTIIYACSDCHYSETYLSDADFPRPLESYDGWERVSPPASGPFR
jgi:hypothetical protein